jgi:hypothetical protein
MDLNMRGLKIGNQDAAVPSEIAMIVMSLLDGWGFDVSVTDILECPECNNDKKPRKKKVKHGKKR